ncbi:hypothetical protein JIG36_29810 [Actinoplanes sp. LDG1-06]|uniref:Uncharacterized protein n=1 Tax=Paractinoplanes ovalisporus TaxID=2810368 RepID=A0ABS2AIN0_9ACTN|nr:hypothetical protein [Actinoplanes ovalisporus]MBM2619712.1 hypothetical protein [Actinoplanes ovalisporus]
MADLLLSDAAPSRHTVPALLTVGAAGVLFLGAFGSPATDTSDQLARVSLAAGGSTPALFDARQLVPGHEVSGCLTITGKGSEREVRLAATELSGSLVNGLKLRVEVGTGECAVFTGQTVYDGTLTGLAADGPTGVATGWAPRTGESRTYRLTVEVADDNSLQHTTGGATFTWLRAPAPTTSPTTSPTVSPAPSKTPNRSTTPTPSASPSVVPSTPVASPSASPSVVPSTPTASPDDFTEDSEPTTRPTAAPPGPGPTHPDKPSGAGWSTILAQVTDTAFRLLMATAGHPWYLAISLSAMWLFLFIADRREKRDPKLSLAPVLRDPYLTFPRNEDHRADME